MKKANTSLSYFTNFSKDYKRQPSLIKENIYAEEDARKVPIRVSSAYGKRNPIEQHSRHHVRIVQTKEFYSKNGVGL